MQGDGEAHQERIAASVDSRSDSLFDSAGRRRRDVASGRGAAADIEGRRRAKDAAFIEAKRDLSMVRAEEAAAVALVQEHESLLRKWRALTTARARLYTKQIVPLQAESNLEAWITTWTKDTEKFREEIEGPQEESAGSADSARSRKDLRIKLAVAERE